jgi:hypothetical protein
MSRSFTAAGIPSALGELAEEDEFVDLGAVSGIGEAAGAEAVAEGKDGVVGFDDLQQAVVMLEEGVLGVVVCHPLDGEGAAARDNVHDPAFAIHPFDGGAGDAAVDGDEVDAVIEMLDDAGKDVLDGHVDDRLLLAVDGVESGLIEGDGADTGIGLGDDGAADLVDRPAGGEVHDRVGTGGDRHPRLFQLLVDAGIVAAGADIGVDLGAQPEADGERDAVGAAVVVADDGSAVSDALAQEFRIDPFGCSGLLHQIGNQARTGGFECGHGFPQWLKRLFIGSLGINGKHGK